MSRLILSTSVLALICAAGCDKGPKSSTSTTAAEHPTTQPTGAAATPKAETAPTVQATPGKPVLKFENVGLSTPETVLYDDATDTYLVSNIDGKALEVDGKGFISRLKPDGSVDQLKWIESGKNKVTLNAPKGMAFLGDRLYVADLDTVRIFDRGTGAPAGEVKVPGATFLNGVTVVEDRVVVADTGMKAGGKGFEPSGTDAIYAIDKDRKLTTIAKGKELGNPNGLLGTKDKTWAVSFGTNELYSIDQKGKKGEVTKLPKGQLDGIVAMRGMSDEVLVSSWEASTIYRGKPGGEFTPVAENVKSPAGIGFDSKRRRLLVPRFDENQVDVFELR